VSAETTRTAVKYIEIDRRQMSLRSIDVEALIDESHGARTIWEFVGRLKLQKFEEKAKTFEGQAGRSTWPPQLLISMWIYAYSKGISSAREISRQCEYEPGFEWLTGLQPVNHHTLSDFRVKHQAALKELFTQVLALLTMNGLISLERVTQDGTKIRADVNRKSFSKPARIREHLKLAREQVELMEQQSQQEEQIASRLRAARARARREQVQKLEQALREMERLTQEKKNQRAKEPQVSFTDPDAHFMRTAEGGLAPAYNVQFCTDTKHGLIVDVETVGDPQDAAQMSPAMERVKSACGKFPAQAIADGGYTNHSTITDMADRGIDYYGAWTGRNERSSTENLRGKGYHWSQFKYDEQRCEYVCPEEKRLGFHHQAELGPDHRLYIFAASKSDCAHCPSKSKCCPNTVIAKHGRTVSIDVPHASVLSFDAKMETEEAKQIYKQRAPIAEFPNAWIKTKFAFRRFRCRGLVRVRSEAIWAALTYNLQRFFQLRHTVAA
jgi:transposase